MTQPAKLLLWSSNLWYFGAGLLGPLFAVFVEEIGGDVLDISGAWALYLIASGLLTILIGRLTEYVDQAKLLLLGYSLNAACTFGYLLIETTDDLFLLQIGFGVANALANPTWSALFDRYTDDTHNGLPWGLSYGLADIFTGVAVFLGGILITVSSFSTLFIVMGSVQVCATVLQIKMLRSNATTPS